MIPCNLITGFLGVGKTTTLLNLLKNKNPNERWAILVNEFGDVGIDGAILEAEAPNPGQLEIREVTGGCVCCTSLPLFDMHLAMLLREAKPDRVLIETSGLAHPARILDTIRKPTFAEALEPRATLAILTPDDFQNQELRQGAVFQDQIQFADVLILNKKDRASEALLAEFQEWGNNLFPPKWLIVATSYGAIDPAWLDAPADLDRKAIFPNAHEHEHEHTHDENKTNEDGGNMLGLSRPIRPGQPRRQESHPSARPAACGWLFHPEDTFDEDRLNQVLMQLPAERLKGVFHVEGGDWLLIQRVGHSYSSQVIEYRRDSRVEIFAPPGTDWLHWDAALRGALLQHKAGEA